MRLTTDRYKTSSLSFLILAAFGCSPTNNPHLNICQDVTQNILQGQKISWRQYEEVATENELSINLSFNSSSGEAVRVSCSFGVDDNGDDAVSENSYEGSPQQVAINGELIDQPRLMQATLDATRTVVQETVEQTAKKSREFAQAASERTRDMTENATEQARQAAINAAERIQGALQQ